MMVNKRVLVAVAHLPPPIHGASLRNAEFLESPVLHDCFQPVVVPLQVSDSISDMGRWSLKKASSALQIIRKAWSECVRRRPAVLYVTLSSTGFAFFKDCILVLLCRRYAQRTVVHLRNYGLGRTSSGKLARLVGRIALRDVYGVVLAESLRSDAEAFLSRHKITVVGNCIDDRAIPSELLNPAENLDSEQLVSSLESDGARKICFYHVANLSVDKGSVMVLQAFIELYNRGVRNATLTMIGEWSSETDREDANKLMSDCNIPAGLINFAGPLYGEKKWRVINANDVHVFPTTYAKECFPGVILEAMALGKPTIATRHAAIPDVITNGCDGFLVDASRCSELVDKMMEFVRSPGLIGCFGRRARRKYFEMYSMEIVHSNIVNALLGDKE